MKKRLIITIDYNNYLLPESSDIGNALAIFSSMIKVNRDGYGKDARYIPQEDEVEIEFKQINESQIQALSETEKAEKEMKSLKSSISYKDERIKKLEKEISEVKCINQALCEKDEGNEGDEGEDR